MKVYKNSDPIVISNGNTKIGKIPNISLLPVATCNKEAPCITEGCYSTKALKRFKTVRLARHHNLKVWLSNPKRYFKELSDYLKRYEPAYFRFHVDGDIPSQDYVEDMINLANNHPATRMLAFTKQYHLNFYRSPNNLIIIPSAWPGLKLPDTMWKFNVAWMQDGREKRNQRVYFNCHKHCDECYACWHINDIDRDVVFIKH